jgi:hypothetical protein
VEPLDQRYVPPVSDGDAVNIVLDPAQIVVLLTVTEIAGVTVTTTLNVVLHPFTV